MTPPRESHESKDNTLVSPAKIKNKFTGNYEQSCTHSNRFSRSVADERPERLADVVPDDEIGAVILFGGLVVDDDELCAAGSGHHREPGRRPDHERRSDREKQIAMLRKFGC